jgi:hypothetical protein
MLRFIICVMAIGPLLIAFEMSTNCLLLRKHRAICDPNAQIPSLVQSTATTVFAWLANPPDH